MIQIKRVYEINEPSDGIRILVDRLWPRGISKEKANLDFWMKDVAPSSSLRKWFNHEESKFSEFKKAYESELAQDEAKQECLEKIMALSHQKKVTLVYGAKHPSINHAVVLLDFIQTHFQTDR
ncbi:DUF488 family protein [Terrilactibacillus sp. BCM23-1]|uniref:DUF488 family protein n=1 Tax=Terrilactibacillus tamarindi TaxID=2599694 RepID=A0A6N8CMT1_9BACI|nr:DUF488 domain-containing protein [Terrilactibacillus tamarindi]MTT31352.1 DUF488 family protein [Terrilactibacillus tamarindi]